MIEALKLLDSELVQAQTIYVCGGTAISLRFQSRPTADVDVVEPEVSGELIIAANESRSILRGDSVKGAGIL